MSFANFSAQATLASFRPGDGSIFSIPFTEGKIALKPEYINGFFVICCALFIWKYLIPGSKYSATPGIPAPGPKGLPLVGNMFDIPLKNRFETYSKWKREYGNIFKLSVLGQPMIILNDRKSIEDLLDKRGAIYSDRPVLTLFRNSKWGGFGWALLARPYDEELHRQRRLMNSCLNPSGTQTYLGEFRRGALYFAKQCIDDPKDFNAHAHFNSSANIMSVAYGYRATERNDTYIGLAKDGIASVAKIGSLGAHPVDIFPSLRFLPQWLFGFEKAKTLKKMRQVSRDLFKLPYEDSLNRVKTGVALQPSMVKTLTTQNMQDDGSIKDEYSIKSVTAMAYIAGADATAATLNTFLLAMLLFPEVQLKARAAVDKVLEGERLPEFSDRSALPYLEAVLKETLRWNPAVPLGVPHRVIQDDVYDGIKIPGGALVIANSWEILHDPKDFPEPWVFRPERFLDPTETKLRTDIIEPGDFAFGFGRRVCTGRHLADNSVWMSLAMTIALFDIQKELDANGKPIEPDMEYLSTFLVARPKAFKCRFTPRSPAAIELLNQALDQL